MIVYKLNHLNIVISKNDDKSLMRYLYSDKLLTEAGLLAEAGIESVSLLMTSSGLRT